MTTFTVIKLNETHLRVECDAEIVLELHEHFTFIVKNYQFTPSFKSGEWDGKIHLFNKRTRTIYLGLLSEVKSFANKFGYSVIEQGFDKDELIEDAIESVIRTYPLHKDIKLRDYQLASARYFIKKRRAVILSSTGSGKSLIIFLATQWYIMNYDKKVLIIVPTLSLVEQMKKDFLFYSDAVDQNIIHLIYGGKGKIIPPEAKIIISTWQGIYKLDQEWFKDFEMLIADECHQYKAPALIATAEKCVNAKWRLGTTGTLDGLEISELTIRGLFGDIYKTISTHALQQRGYLAGLDIKHIVLSYGLNTKQLFKKQCKTYQDEINFISTHEARNNFISKIIVNQKGNTLVLFNRISGYGRRLENNIKILLGEEESNKRLFFVYGGTDVEERERIREIVEKEKDIILLASIGVFSTGINMKEIHTVIFPFSMKSRIRVLQSIGRGLRISQDKTNTTLIDIADELSIKNYSMIHAAERLKIYQEEKFNIKKIGVHLND